MAIKDLIKAEVDTVEEAQMGELYDVVRSFTRNGDHSKADKSKPSLMSKLREIQIDGPEDFAANLVDRHFPQAGFQALLREEADA